MSSKQFFLNISEKEYREIDAVSYSLLTSDNFSASKYSPAFKMGGYIDKLAFGQDLSDYGFITTNKVPSKSTNIGKFIEAVNKSGVNLLTCSTSTPELSRAYNDIGIKRPSLSSLHQECVTSFPAYIDELDKSRSKEIISKEEDILAMNLVNELKTNTYVKKYFDSIASEGLENLFQVPVIINVNLESGETIRLKILLDILHIDHNRKTVKPIDLKTTSDNTSDFSYSFIKYKYYIQSSLYKFVLSEYLKTTGLSEYEVLDFCFIPIKKHESLGRPLVYSVNEHNHNIGLNGGTFKYSMRPIKGAFQLIREFIALKNLNNFTYNLDVQQNNGEIELDV